MQLPNADAWPRGDLRGIYLHWTGGGYGDVFDAYHFCVTADGGDAPQVVATHDLRVNMRDVRSGSGYAAHTFGRNSFAIGIAICAMRDATPNDFGPVPLRDDQVHVACALAALLCAAYAIDISAVRTHAEAALEDGYFGCGEEQRWDIARLQASPVPLDPAEAGATGERLRALVQSSARHGS